MTADTYDVICIGAGPTGLACAIEAKRAGMRPLVIDKGFLCNSLYHYPTNMNFFTTPERMEIGDLPMTISGGKPTRPEAHFALARALSRHGQKENAGQDHRLHISMKHVAVAFRPPPPGHSGARRDLRDFTPAGQIRPAHPINGVIPPAYVRAGRRRASWRASGRPDPDTHRSPA